MFGVLALVGLYGIVAPLVPLWPFGHIRATAQVVDDLIRAGREARDRITYEKLDTMERASTTALWMLRAANALEKRYPAIADEFLLASADSERFSGQAFAIQAINSKLAVLSQARKQMGTD